MSDDSNYGIVANVIETDRVFRTGAKAWIADGTGGEGWHRFIWLALSRGGRTVTKWAPIVRFNNFRAKWIPENMRGKIHGQHMGTRGTKEGMEKMAKDLNEFSDEQRECHPDRRISR